MLGVVGATLLVLTTGLEGQGVQPLVQLCVERRDPRRPSVRVRLREVVQLEGVVREVATLNAGRTWRTRTQGGTT